MGLSLADDLGSRVLAQRSFGNTYELNRSAD
jgi:hypothetical protein